MNDSHSLRDFPPKERPRERLRNVGAENLSLQELLALIIEKGGKNQNVLQIAQNLLSHFGNLDKLKATTLEELQEVQGIGFATACKLKAAFVLGGRLNSDYKIYGEKITKAEAVFDLLGDKLAKKKKEYFLVLALDSRHRLLAVEEVAVGSLNVNSVHPREIFLPVISAHGASAILVHNHPSGDSQPSNADIKVTRQLKEAGETLGIKILDHIVIGRNSFCRVNG
ncbi:MAG: RadC family protein [Patescibacteria group bacterium]